MSGAILSLPQCTFMAGAQFKKKALPYRCRTAGDWAHGSRFHIDPCSLLPTIYTGRDP